MQTLVNINKQCILIHKKEKNTWPKEAEEVDIARRYFPRKQENSFEKLLTFKLKKTQIL